MRLRRKIFWRVMILVAVSIVLSSILTSFFLIEAHRRHAKEVYSAQATFVAERAERRMLWDDRISLHKMLLTIVSKTSELEYAFIERQKQPYVHSFDQGVPEKLLGLHGDSLDGPSVCDLEDEKGCKLCDIAVPVGDDLAILHIGLSRDLVDQHTLKGIVPIAAIAAVMVILGVFLAAFTSLLTTKEVDGLTKSLRESRDELEIRVEERTSELSESNEKLLLEISDRERVEKALRESEQKLAGIVDSVTDAMVMVDEQFDIVWTNDHAKDLFGPKWIGKKCYEFFHGRETVCEPCIVKQCFEDGKVHEFETEMTKTAGSHRSFWCTASVAARDEDDHPIMVVEFLRDITERKQAQKEIETLKQQMEFILGVTKTGIDIIDSDYNIQYIDPEWEKVYGDPAGRKCYEYFMGESEPCPDCGITKAMKTKAAVVTEEVLVKEGNRPIQVTTIPFRNDEGEWLFAEVNVDISERKRAEEALKDSEQQKEAILDAGVDMIMQYDTDLRILWANKTAAEFVNKVPQDLVGNKCHKIFQGLDSPCPGCPCVKVLETGNAENAIMYHADMDAVGESYWHNYAVPIKDESGKVDSIIEIARNVTEQKQAEEALRESEEKYRTITATAQDAIIMMDNEGDISYWNPAAERMFGYTAEEAIGQELHVFLGSQRYHEAYRKGFKTFRETGQGVAVGKTLELSAVRKDGTEFPIELSVSSIQIQGKWHATGIMRDISERRQAEEALRESEEKYRTLFEDSRDAIYVTALEGEFVDANQSALDIFGYTREEMIGLNARQIYVNPEKRIQFQHEMEEKGSVRDYEVKFRKKNGIEMDCLVTSSLRRSKDGTILGYQGIIRDITEQKWAQLEKKKLEAQLQQAQKMEAIGTLAGGIAHDFNNILTPMIIHTEIAMSNLAEESPVRENLLRVSQAAHRAKEVVSLILTFSRQASVKPLPMKLSPIVKEVLKLLRASLPTTIEIRQDIKSTSDLTVADPTQIHQVLINLCTNAEHAMRDKGGVLEVSLTDIELGAEDAVKFPYIKPGPYLKLTVSDTGAGMDRMVADRIFDPFFTTKQRGEGTGMGLAVVHGIVTSCGGAITVDSEPEKGTAFHIIFPRTETEAPTQIRPVEPLPTGNEQILLVDDDKVVVDAVRMLLESLGYKVVASKNGLEALEVFRPQPDEFDLVITDQTMPHMQGKELAQELIRIRPDIPIILCTGYSDQITEDVAKAIGIREYVMKPFVMDDMARIIRKVLNK